VLAARSWAAVVVAFLAAAESGAAQCVVRLVDRSRPLVADDPSAIGLFAAIRDIRVGWDRARTGALLMSFDALFALIW